MIRADYEPPKRSLSRRARNERGGMYILSGQDMGKPVAQQFGSTDYEYALSIYEEDMPKLWPFLMKYCFSGSSPLSISALKAISTEAGVDPHFFSWP